jgi:exopolyphosphatase/guanosine-5'-triphosphate,3'-diphosphate pyrophosphatase
MTTDTRHSKPTPAGGPPAAVRPVAVIDVGTTSIRMAIAELGEGGEVRRLERLARPVPIGRDTFTTGSIARSTIEECVQVLRNYRRVLQEYQVESDDRIRVVATTAVREAANRLTFLDRVYIATGFRVEPIDEAEVTRLNYMAVQPVLARAPALQRRRVLVTEVGGGSTEMLLLQGGEVVASHAYRLGSYRLRKTLESYRAPDLTVRSVMVRHVRRMVDQARRDVADGDLEVLALGGDVRFAARRLLPDWDPAQIGVLAIDDLRDLVDGMLGAGTDKLARRYSLTFAEAETVGPALLTYLELARAFSLDHLHVSSATLRDGMLAEMGATDAWSESFRDQILRSALDLGRRFQFDEPHARHTAELSRTLFRALQEEHGLAPRYEMLLEVAALLHDVGYIVSNRSHHKHAMYLILHGELFGIGSRDLTLVALVARYHRRAVPRPTHELYATLSPDERITVAKLAAILRIADALDRSNSQRVREIECERVNGRFVISVPRVDDLSLEQLALRDKGSMFENVYGMKAQLRRAARETT